MCVKGTGRYFCTGCKKYFCKNDFHSHRETLTNELDEYIEDRNALQEKIIHATQQKDIHSPLLRQIDEWQQITIEKVKKTAEQARQNVKQILNSKRIEIKSEFDKFSQELRQLKETEDYAEQDLEKLKQTISRLKRDLKQLEQPPAIELHVEESQNIAWSRLIYVAEKTNYATQQKQNYSSKRGEFMS